MLEGVVGEELAEVTFYLRYQGWKKVHNESFSSRWKNEYKGTRRSKFELGERMIVSVL